MTYNGRVKKYFLFLKNSLLEKTEGYDNMMISENDQENLNETIGNQRRYQTI